MEDVAAFASTTRDLDKTERRALYKKYIERLQARYNLNQKEVFELLGKRLDKGAWSMTSWASSSERHNVIPWPLLDILLNEELLMTRQNSISIEEVEAQRLRLLKLYGIKN